MIDKARGKDKVIDLEKKKYTTTRIKVNDEAFQNNNDFWTNWKVHRDNYINLIEKHIIGNYKINTIAIFGAGKCNDLDLQYFCSTFKEVHLFDVQTEDVKRGIEFQNISSEWTKKIYIHPSFNFVGIEDDFYERIEQMLIDKLPMKLIVKLIRKQANKLSVNIPLQHILTNFDMSISMGVHSQLFSEGMLLIHKYMDHYGVSDSLKIHEEIRYLYWSGVKVYNELLYSSVKTGGLLYIGFDLLEFSKQANTLDLLPEFKELIKQGDVLDYMPAYSSKYGVMGSVEGFSDFGEYMKKNGYDIPINFWIWDYFDFQSYFFVTMGLIKKE